MLDAIKVIILGIVQGITEWLPISSTGHLLLFQEFLNLQVSVAFLEMFNVVIQLGSIMAVVVLYFHKLNPFSPQKSKKQKKLTIQLWIKVLVASLPAAIIGLLFNDWIDDHFFNVYVVAAMLILYGIIFIFVERWRKDKTPKYNSIYQLTIQTVLIIGVFQVLALIPGTSRSGATILGALIIGTARGVAAEFTFFLAIPVMFGASLLKLINFGVSFSGNELFLLILGSLVSFAVSLVALRFLVGYVKKHDFQVFGYYRIIVGVVMFAIFGIRMLIA
ncbi:MAG: undecaprenyl-diphosphate phosphatase [Lachnospiraceae bacterium]|nr:undecaprenyl-diphosphate phosphatase [Lachnospiraceae bacterium]